MIRRIRKIAASAMIAGALGVMSLGITLPTASAQPWGGCGYGGGIGIGYGYGGGGCGQMVWKGGPAGLPPVLVPIQQANWGWVWCNQFGAPNWYLQPPGGFGGGFGGSIGVGFGPGVW